MPGVRFPETLQHPIGEIFESPQLLKEIFLIRMRVRLDKEVYISIRVLVDSGSPEGKIRYILTKLFSCRLCSEALHGNWRGY